MKEKQQQLTTGKIKNKKKGKSVRKGRQLYFTTGSTVNGTWIFPQCKFDQMS